MSNGSKAIRIFPTKEELASFISGGVVSAVSNLPLAATDIGTYLLTVGAAVSASSIGEWGKEIADFIKSKKAKNEEEAKSDYEKFFETLRFLAREQPSDKELLKALKSLHTLGLSKDTNAAEATEVYMLIDTAKKLRGDEIMTLLAAYRIWKKLYSPGQMEAFLEGYEKSLTWNSVNAWCTVITRACGYSTDDYVKRQQEHLEDLHLITMRLQRQGYRVSEFEPNSSFRLTESGARLAEFIIKGEELVK